MGIPAGSRLGPYEILTPIGAGGMGEVYRAKDPRLGRDVAIKVLPASFSSDPDRLRRFEQEARAAGILNHPNITAVLDIGEHEGAPYVVQELLEGETLRHHLAGGKLSARKAIDYAIQIAHGLAAAHEKGIVHRDLKPENVFVTKDGRVKILDFGLAKLTHAEEGGVTGVTNLPTATAGTEPGVVLGTLGYMSPEQVRGRSADARSDIFAFGAILYEMLAGQRAFRGDSAADTMSAILKEDPPDLSVTNANVPPGLERIVRHCLEKSPEQRFQSARDLAFDLEALSGVSMPSGRALSRKTDQGARGRPVLVAIAVILLAGVATLLLRPRRTPVIESLAVLPFVNATKDPGVDYLSDGLTDSLVETLARLPRLRVTARTISARYKGRESDPQKAGRELGVNAVLSGEVLQRGDSLTVHAELVDVAAGTQLWGDHYSRKASEVLSVQDELAKEISERLRPRLTGEERTRLTRRTTEDAEAYRLYLLGRHAWEQRTDEALMRSIEYFKRAIDRDPSYALAYSGLADSYAVLGINVVTPPGEAFPKASAAARKALELDGDLAQPHATLGWALTAYDWQYPAAELEFRRALSLDPYYATAHHWYGLLLSALGRSEEAIALLRKATEIDPVSGVLRANWVRVLVNARQFDRAMIEAKRLIDDQPRKTAGYMRMGTALEGKNMRKEAAAEYEKAATAGETGTSYKIFVRARSAALLGNIAEARRLTDEFERLAEGTYVSPFDIARLHHDLGDRDQTFDWLERAYVERSSELMFLNVNPLWDDIRSEPRFVNLMKRVRLVS